ncbi:hypothetical protein [Oscillibacter sp. GMB15532]|uniref:hypothetical protein n=1 Tax=Oscillibacter sp. GMB15532 TaxID=3230022 RepID=UPI0034DFB26C
MFLRRGKEKKNSPNPDEFWLSQGDFRISEALPEFVRYYGIPTFFYEKNVSEQEKNEEKFRRIVGNAIKCLLKGNSSMLLIEDRSQRSAGLWTDEMPKFKEMALSEGGTLLEAHDSLCGRYLFTFTLMPDLFFEKIYHLFNGDCRYQSIYVTYSVLGKSVQEGADLASFKKATLLNMYIDNDHPVLIIQAAPQYPLKKISDALSAACQLEGWIFRTLFSSEAQTGNPGSETGNRCNNLRSDQ